MYMGVYSNCVCVSVGREPEAGKGPVRGEKESLKKWAGRVTKYK